MFAFSTLADELSLLLTHRRIESGYQFAFAAGASFGISLKDRVSAVITLAGCFCILTTIREAILTPR
jgi:hypothetical protein